MIIISNRILVKIITFNFARAITIFPFIFVSDIKSKDDKVLINHEMIHIRQQIEMLIIPFYIWYFLEFIFRWIQFGTRYDAYINISFEKEAYANEINLNYNKSKKFWSFLKYI